MKESAYIDKLLVALVLGPPSLVLEHNVVIPSPLQVEVLGVQQRIASRNVHLPLFLFLGGAFLFL